MYKNWRELIRPRSVQVDEESQTNRYGKFVVEPLERGFGVSLGNALRRVLLSSLRGAAVTAVRIEGVEHEFATIPNVLEDVAEIILNLKALNLQMNVDGPKTLQHKFTGEQVVTAGALFSGPEVRALDPDQHVMTIGAGGQVVMETVVSAGAGYQPAERLADPNAPIGTIPLDAMFSPIRKVNFRVTNARVGNRTDYDRLTLEVWTNGSVSPRDAVAIAAKILKEQLQVFIHFDEGAMEPARPAVRAPVAAAETPARIEDIEAGSRQDLLYRLVEELDLSVRAQNCLKAGGIVYVGDLIQKTESELMGMENFGRKSLKEIKDALTDLGLSLGMRLEDFDPSRASR